MCLDLAIHHLSKFDSSPGYTIATASKVVHALKADGSLPVLHAASVTFIGLGQVAGNQQQISEAGRNALISLMIAICSAATGDHNCTASTDLVDDRPSISTQPVPVIALPAGWHYKDDNPACHAYALSTDTLFAYNSAEVSPQSPELLTIVSKARECAWSPSTDGTSPDGMAS